MTSTVTLIEDFNPEIEVPSLQVAEQIIADRLTGQKIPRTYVVIQGGETIKFVSSRRILGDFVKEVNAGLKSDMAVEIDRESFDATDAVLLMTRENIIELGECEEAVDALARELVAWDGPFTVESLVDSIAEFFAIDNIADLTQDRLDAAVQAHGGVVEDFTVTLTIQVRGKRFSSTDINEFIEDLDYSIRSNTDGVMVTSTEMIDA